MEQVLEPILMEAFRRVLNMSITASYVILVVLLARLLLKKAPKIFSYSLWAVVLFRLLCPVSFSSALSLLGFLTTRDMEHIPGDLVLMSQPQVNVGLAQVNRVINSSLPAAHPAASANPIQILLFIMSVLWVMGMLVLLLYSVVSYLLLKGKIGTAIRLRDNIYECDGIRSPFVLGIIKPRIYMPLGFSEAEAGYLLKHEEIHIRRRDYLVKPLAFLVLSIHWFNPLVWLSFSLMTKDMEMSCDEQVIKELGTNLKKDYSNSLLALAVKRKILGGSPLAFGESNTKSRIKNVLNYKRPVFWVTLLAGAAILVISLGLMANPKSVAPDLSSLNFHKTALAAREQESLMIRAQGHGASLISGEQFGGWLEGVSKDWQEKTVASPLERTPSITVYLDRRSDHQVRFYEAEPELVVIVYDGNYQGYSIPQEDYAQVFGLWAIRSYLIPEAVVRAIADGKRTSKQSIQDIPVGVDYKVLNVGKAGYYIYKEKGRYYCELPYQFIHELSEEVYKGALDFAETPKQEQNPEKSAQVGRLIEDRLKIIMSDPLQSSNPEDYIKAHQMAYEEILKYGGEEALPYLLAQFQQGQAEGLRGQLMMRLCQEFLGVRNNVSDEGLSPQEWFSKLSIRQKVDLPDFSYSGYDPLEAQVYATEVEKYQANNGEFTIVAPHIFGSYEEGDTLKVFVTTFSRQYNLYDKTLSQESGSVVPSAITYHKNPDGSYTLENYRQARDGSEFGPSIQDFCVLPVSGRKISGLANKILTHYGNYQDIIKLERQNLIDHLRRNGQTGVFLHQEHYQKPAELIPLT